MAAKKKVVRKPAEPREREEALFFSTSRRHSVCFRATTYIQDMKGKRVDKPGKVIQFENGFYKTNDPKEIDFLRNRPDYGRMITEPGRQDYSEKIKEKVIQKDPKTDPVVQHEVKQAAANISGGIL